MSRKIVVAGAQLGPINRTTPRSAVLDRMLSLMDQAQASHAKLIVYPEIAFTTFFPRHLITDPTELESWFEHDVNGDATQAPNMKPLFDRAREFGMDVSVGYAEHDTSQPEAEHVHYNTAVYFSATAGKVISKYRKIHLPGTVEPYTTPGATQQLEKRYFRPGNLGFEAFRAPGLIDGAAKKTSTLPSSTSAAVTNGAPNTTPTPNSTPNAALAERSTSSQSSHAPGTGDPIVGTIICNDRRWPEAWRSLGLQGTELLLCGYNTTGYNPDLLGLPHPRKPPLTQTTAYTEALFHHMLTIQHGSYTNACFSINVARCGLDDGTASLIGGSCIVDPDGEVVVKCATEAQDELMVAEIDLAECRRGKARVFDFDKHRRVETYGRLAGQTGVVEPELLEG